LENFDIGRIIVTEGRKIYGFALEASYEKGVLRQLGELVEKYGNGALYSNFNAKTE
jgi:hypothetical protein